MKKDDIVNRNEEFDRTPSLYLYDDEELLLGSEDPQNSAKRNGFGVFLAIFFLFVLFLLCIYFLARTWVGNRQDTVDIDTPIEENESVATAVWSGAFDSREISERCIRASVRIRLGAAGEYGAVGASGVVVGEDGWILTSDSIISNDRRGRLYALMQDGREYPVEFFVREREDGIAFLKINASGLEIAKIEDDLPICAGQSLVAVRSSGSPEHNSLLSVGIASSAEIENGSQISGSKQAFLKTDMFFDISSL